jgi:hypothetical protein
MLDSLISLWHHVAMPKGKDQVETGTWIVRDVPKDVMHRAKVAAVIQKRSVKAILIELMEGYLQDLEKKGILPKGQ